MSRVRALDGISRDLVETQDPRELRARAEDAEPWGFLPVRERERFLNAGDRDLPIQYRAWIDAHHRRLSRSRR